MSELTLQRWEREFRRDAKSDDMAILRDHLRRLDLSATPESMLECTIIVVQACLAYAAIDGRSSAPMLEMQTYAPARSVAARYAFTFELCGKTFARLLLPAKVAILDLADLYDHPWADYRVCGFSRFWITRSDWTALTSEEMARLEQQVTDDLWFDYSENDLDIWFDGDSTAGALLVTVQDRLPLDEDT